MKNLIFCSDGTSNTQKNRTNVFQVYSMLIENEENLKLYDRGVGTKLGNILRGCAFGVGLHLNILDGFRFLSEHYEPGDRIYLFGFSRGAYTVRSLASMISICGLAPAHSSNRLIRKFWKAYCSNRNPDKFQRRQSDIMKLCKPIPAKVEAICVWDTVGSIGKQTRTKQIRKKLAHRYHRMTVHRNIRNIYHAVSIDERRTLFYPHLLHQQIESEGTHVEEVWFAGVHSDIGGCFRNDESSLGDITLKWMISRVAGELPFKEEALQKLNPDPLGRMHNKEGGLIFSFFHKANRPVRRNSCLHRSVRERIASPPHEYHQHREPSGNYTPLALNFCHFSNPPNFGLDVNYEEQTD